MKMQLSFTTLMATMIATMTIGSSSSNFVMADNDPVAVDDAIVHVVNGDDFSSNNNPSRHLRGGHENANVMDATDIETGHDEENRPSRRFLQYDTGFAQSCKANGQAYYWVRVISTTYADYSVTNDNTGEVLEAQNQVTGGMVTKHGCTSDANKYTFWTRTHLPNYNAGFSFGFDSPSCGLTSGYIDYSAYRQREHTFTVGKGYALNTAVTYNFNNYLNALCSDTTRAVDTVYSGYVCNANGDIKWTSMSTTNPTHPHYNTQAVCSWVGTSYDATWNYEWLGTNCGQKPNQINIPTNTAGLSGAAGGTCL